MAIFTSKFQRQVMCLVKEMQQGFFQDDFHRQEASANQAISMLESSSEWPMFYFFRRDAIHADLLINRAMAREALSRNAIKSDKSIFEDYWQAIQLLRDDMSRNMRLLLRSSQLLLNYCLYDFQSAFDEREQIGKIAEQCLDFLEKYPEPKKDDFEVGLFMLQRSILYSKFFLTNKTHCQKAIDLLIQAQAIFLRLNRDEQIFFTNSMLAEIHLNPILSDDPSSLDKSMAYAKEAISSDIAQKDPLQMGLLFANLGEAYAYRPYGDRPTNWGLAVFCYWTALQDLPEENEIGMVDKVFLKWTSLLSEGVPYRELHLSKEEILAMDGKGQRALAQRIESMKPIEDQLPDVDQRLTRIFELADPSRDALTLQDALHLKSYLSQFSESKFYSVESTMEDELNKLTDQIDPKEQPSLWASLQMDKAGERFDGGEPNAVHQSLEVYLEVTRHTNFSDEPVKQFDINARIGSCYSALEDWHSAHDYFSKAMDVLSQTEGGHFAGLRPGDHSLPNTDYVLRMIPLASAEAGEYADSLKYFDTLNSGNLTESLQILFAINQQINRESLYRKYIEMKMGQRTLLATDLDDSSEYLRSIDERRAALDVLKSFPEFVNRGIFFKHLEKQLSEIDQWIFIPVSGNDHSRLMLIPPKGKISDMYISKQLDFGFNDTLHILHRKAEGGWSDVIHRFGMDEKALKKQGLLDPSDSGELEEEFLTMAESLWVHYGGWIVSVLSLAETENRMGLCIIAAQHLSLFPFSMAENPYQDEQLIDYAHISYAPSIYALYSLVKRAESYQESPSLTHITGTPIDDDGTESSEPKMRLKQIYTEKHFVDKYWGLHTQKSLNHYETDFHNLREAIRNATHLHFSSHGSFEWSASYLSGIELGNRRMETHLVEGFTGEEPFRLVTLASCQSAMQNSMNEHNDAEGLPNRFLEMGAIGVIGSLWAQPDVSSALLSGRFYYYYIKEGFLPARALRAAQCWLRDASREELIEFIDAEISELEPGQKALAALTEMREGIRQEGDFPFQFPLYWAGWVLVGC